MAHLPTPEQDAGAEFRRYQVSRLPKPCRRCLKVGSLPPRHDSVGIFFPIQALGTEMGGSGTWQWRLCLDLIGMS